MAKKDSKQFCYPFKFAKNEKVVKYLDLPIQHISNNILRKMARRTNKQTIISIIEKYQ